MENNKRLLVWIFIPVLLAGGAFAFWSYGKGNSAQESYLTEKVIKGDVEVTVSALGTLQPFEYVDVGTQVTGQLKELYVTIGQQVSQGDLVAEIDATLLTSRHEASLAALTNVKAQLSMHEIQHRLAKQQHTRNKELYLNQAVSEEALQQSQATVDQAAAQVEAMKAQILQAQYQVNGDQANLRYTKIFAPMTGTVISLSARKGQTLVATQQVPVILRIANMKTMTVWAQVSEADVPKIAPKMPVYFTTLGLPDRRWHGVVKQILPTPENVNNVILYNVLFDVGNADQILKPQMSTQTSFAVAKVENTVVVPTSALRAATKQPKSKEEDRNTADAVKMSEKNVDKPNKTANGKTVPHSSGISQALYEKENKAAGSEAKLAGKPEGKLYTVRVLNRDGQVEERQVTIGVMSRTKAQVLSGLAEGEEIIIGTAEETGKQKGKSKGQSNQGKV